MPEPEPVLIAEPEPERVLIAEPEPEPDSEPDPDLVSDPDPGPDPEPAPVPRPTPESPGSAAAPGAVRSPEAVALLARLRCEDPRLLLADRDVRQLAPDVVRWLEHGAEPEAVRHVLTSDLPADLRHPARLIAHRLKALIPPRLPAAAPVRPVRPPDPLQNCDGCDRAFRAPAPGRCRDCPPVRAAGQPLSAGLGPEASAGVESSSAESAWSVMRTGVKVVASTGDCPLPGLRA